MKINIKNDFVVMGLLYLVMHGGIFFIPNAIFWDDWVLYRAPSSTVLEIFRQAGSMFNMSGYLHVLMLNIGPWIYKVLTFILMFASGLLLNPILERNGLLTKECRFFTVLLFLLLPFNLARVALINFPSTLCYFLFFLAWFLMDKRKIVALLLFFVSFSLNSLLVFYTLPFLDMAYRSGNLTSPKSFFSYACKRPGFLLVPFLFFGIKVFFFSPTGAYSGYNQGYALSNVVSGVKLQLIDLMRVRVNPYIFLLLLPFVFFLLTRKQAEDTAATDVAKRQVWTIVALGAIALILGAFPYLIIGHTPTFIYWTSRHQILLPFGAALVLAAILCALRKPLKIAGMCLIIAASLSYGLKTYYSLFLDWNKQVMLIELFRNSPIIKDSKLVIFKDDSKSLNVFSRAYSFYEWNGLMEMAYGTENHFGINSEDLTHYRKGKFDIYFSGRLKASSHIRDIDAPAVLVKINQVKTNKAVTNLVGKVFPDIALTVSPLTQSNLSDDQTGSGNK